MIYHAYSAAPPSLEHELIFETNYPNYVQHWIDEPSDAAIAAMQ